MGSRGGFAFNVSGSAVGTAKPVSRGGQRAGHRAGVSHQSFDDRRGGTAPAKTSGADFEPSWHLDLGGLLNGGEKRSPAAQSSGNESGSAGAGAGLGQGAGMQDGVARVAHCMVVATTSAQPVRRCGTQQLHTDSPPGEMLLARAATGHRDRSSSSGGRWRAWSRQRRSRLRLRR